jgi:hypothetical protein
VVGSVAQIEQKTAEIQTPAGLRSVALLDEPSYGFNRIVGFHSGVVIDGPSPKLLWDGGFELGLSSSPSPKLLWDTGSWTIAGLPWTINGLLDSPSPKPCCAWFWVCCGLLGLPFLEILISYLPDAISSPLSIDKPRLVR